MAKNLTMNNNQNGDNFTNRTEKYIKQVFRNAFVKVDRA